MSHGSDGRIVSGWVWWPDGSCVNDSAPAPWMTHISRVVGARVEREYDGVWSVSVLLDVRPGWMTVQAWHAGSQWVTGGVVVEDGEQEAAARACAAKIMDDLRAWLERSEG